MPDKFEIFSLLNPESGTAQCRFEYPLAETSRVIQVFSHILYLNR